MASALWPPCKWQHVSPSFWCQQTVDTSNLQSYIVREGDDLLKFKAQHMQLRGTVLLAFNKPAISGPMLCMHAPTHTTMIFSADLFCSRVDLEQSG